jgi:hypothetical protein
MAITVLGSLYSELLNGSSNSISNFVEGVKAISAFYILWRACDSNSGIDNYYRTFFKGKDDELDPNHWIAERGEIDIQELKNFFKSVLFRDKNISSKEDWILKASSYLKYENASAICKISLIISAHNTIVDSLLPGLMKPGKSNTSPYFNLSKWNSDDLRDIEHIAPKQNQGNWDERLYDLHSQLYDSLGNLTLLPSEINISASNRGWKEKYLYYQHLGTKDPDKAQELSTKAENEGILLNSSTINMLKNANYNEHILPIIEVRENGNWNSELVARRTERILSIVWDTAIKWLEI